MSIVDLVFQYRTLLARCELSGLEFDQIDELTEIEAMFSPGTDDLHAKDGRRFRRERVVLGGLLRGADLNDRVAIRDLSPAGIMISGAPYTRCGDLVELVIDADTRSYRFKARVQWVREDGNDHQVGLELVGSPVRLTYGPPSEAAPDNVVLSIAA